MIPAERAAFVRCGTLGHAWFDADTEGAPGWGTPMAFRCERCGTFRQDIIDRNGELGARRYVYPDGYRYDRGERPPRADFRLALIAQRLADRQGAQVDTTEADAIARAIEAADRAARDRRPDKLRAAS